MTKNQWIMIAAILLSVCIAAPLAYGAIMQSINNTNTVVIDNPQSIFTLTIDGTQYNDTDTIDWGTLSPGVHTYTISVYNKHTSLIQFFLRVNNLPVGWALTCSLNSTAFTAGQTQAGNIALTIPTTAVHQQTYTFTTVATAEA